MNIFLISTIVSTLLGGGSVEVQTIKMSGPQPTVKKEKKDSTGKERPKTFQEEYEAFKRQSKANYEDFRDKANREYAEFVRKAWEEHQVMLAIPKPKEEEVPPIVIPEDEKAKPIEDKPLPIKDEVIPPPPAPEPQPVPVAPIKEQPKPVEKYVSFTVYGTELKVRFNDDERYMLASCDEDAIADAWLLLSGKNYNNTIRDCIELRITKQLSDWAYMRMLQEFSKACLGNSNEAVLLMAFIYCQSGYKMRLCIFENKLSLLYASQHVIVNHGYFEINGEMFYPFDSDVKSGRISSIGYPQEKPLSLFVPNAQLFTYQKSPLRTLKAKNYAMEVTTCVNKNMVDFYNDYPTSVINDNFMTRWAMYANTPLSNEVRTGLLPALKKELMGLSELQSMEKLLNWVQTAFVYELDDKVWGEDRAFFPEETLYYPYCDCEDRAIFLSRIVRDLLGLKCILIYYPGHLSMAVCFTENVKGDCIMLNGKKFVVCDPTCMGASVGMTAQELDNKTAQVILLE